MTGIPSAVYWLFGAPLAALFAGFFLVRPRKPEWTHWPILASCGAVTAASFALAAWTYAGGVADGPLYAWLAAGDWSISFGVRIDGLTTSVLCMVALVGSLIHLYAAGYMKGDPGFSRFFLVFHLFFLSMIGLLVSNNLAQFYLFWEGVGLASYLLIGHWMKKASARRAALQAFLTNRVGDFGLLLAVLILLRLYGTTAFSQMPKMPNSADAGWIILAALLLFWAASAKSAQFPLYFWLPDAMEGPTPTSALMHAATMVTAGIYLLVRCWPIISAVPLLGPVMCVTGAGTSLFAAILACTQKDLKRILAYSTVSHLGLMVFALSLGRVGPAVFHLVTHGFFKAVLFLCAGNIAHGLGQTTADVSQVGGLRRRMPLTYGCFLAAALSLAGVYPTAGFFSKDAILDAALKAGGLFAAAGLLIALGSSLYIFRMLFLVFFTGGGRAAQKDSQPHEADVLMAAPAVFLAIGALVAGFARGGLSKLLLSGAIPAAGFLELDLGFSWPAFAAGTAMVLLGAGIAYLLTMARPDWDWSWRREHPLLEAAFASDLGFRSVVDGMAGFVAAAAAWIGRVLDEGLWDGFLESSAEATRFLARTGQTLATGSPNDYFWWMATATAMLLAATLRV